jgi:hypothetical protein
MRVVRNSTRDIVMWMGRLETQRHPERGPLQAHVINETILFFVVHVKIAIGRQEGAARTQVVSGTPIPLPGEFGSSATQISFGE